MPKKSETRFGPEVLSVFVGHSNDADEEARAIIGLEGQLRRELEKFLIAKNHDCRYSNLRIWEWKADASSKTGGQEAVVTPELNRADIAVFVFKDRVGEVTWLELQQCRKRKIHIIALFPKQPSDQALWSDLEYMENWTNLLKRKKELTQDWTNPQGLAVTPLEDYPGIEELTKIVFERITNNG
jgi:hypothetical protein